MKQVKTIEELDEILADEKMHNFFISLVGGCARSSKTIQKVHKDYWVMNEIDGTDLTLTAEELTSGSYSNIGEAMVKGAFYSND